MLARCIPTLALDPVLVEIPFPFFGLEGLPIRWYALAYIAGLFFGLWYVNQMVRRPRLWTTHPKPVAAPMSRAFVDDLLLWIMVGVIAGGRIGYVLFYQTAAIWERPLWIATGITEGGMSFHGGLIGVALAIFFTSRAHGVEVTRTADAVAAATPVGLLLGRLANFINGELWGREAPNLPWAMRFAGDPECALRPPRQLYEATLEGLVLFTVIAVLIWKWRALSRPGLVAGVFLAGYGLFRALVELVREPDTHMPEALQGYVTMGMILSLPLILVGAVLIWRALKTRPDDRPGTLADTASEAAKSRQNG